MPATAAEKIANLPVQDQSPLGDSLACLRITLSILVGELGLTGFDGFFGPTAEQIHGMTLTGQRPNFDVSSNLKARLLELLVEADVDDGGSARIARAYLSDSVEDWAQAATMLLESKSVHPALMAVLRKGASLGPTFSSVLEELVRERNCPTILADGTDALKYVNEHAYPRLHRTVRLVDNDNRVLREM